MNNDTLRELGDVFSRLGVKFLEVLAVIFIGVVIIRFAMIVVKKILFRTRMNSFLVSFIISISSVILYFALIFTVAKLLKVPTTTFVAIAGAISLGLSLALQNTLTNMASGTIILVSKPFKEGDFVQIGGVDGFVKNIKLIHTTLLTTDNKLISIPNSSVVTSNIINFDAKSTRRVHFSIAISYDEDIAKTKKVLLALANSTPYVIKDPAPSVYLGEMGPFSMIFYLRIWVKSADYWEAYYNMNEKIIEACRENDIKMQKNVIEIEHSDASISTPVAEDKKDDFEAQLKELSAKEIKQKDKK